MTTVKSNVFNAQKTVFTRFTQILFRSACIKISESLAILRVAVASSIQVNILEII